MALNVFKVPPPYPTPPPREPLFEDAPRITRSWWRFFDSLQVATVASVSSVATSGGISAGPVSGGSVTLTVQWNAGDVNSLGPNLTLTNGVLDADSTSLSQWTAGVVTNVGLGIYINDGTLEVPGLGSTAITRQQAAQLASWGF